MTNSNWQNYRKNKISKKTYNKLMWAHSIRMANSLQLKDISGKDKSKAFTITKEKFIKANKYYKRDDENELQ